MSPPFQVGYRSGLRASQSISDLSHSMSPAGGGGGIGRMQRIGKFFMATSPKSVFFLSFLEQHSLI